MTAPAPQSPPKRHYKRAAQEYRDKISLVTPFHSVVQTVLRLFLISMIVKFSKIIKIAKTHLPQTIKNVWEVPRFCLRQYFIWFYTSLNFWWASPSPLQSRPGRIFFQICLWLWLHSTYLPTAKQVGVFNGYMHIPVIKTVFFDSTVQRPRI